LKFFDQELLVIVGVIFFKKARGSVLSRRIGIKFSRIDLPVDAHRLMESDF